MAAQVQRDSLPAMSQTPRAEENGREEEKTATAACSSAEQDPSSPQCGPKPTRAPSSVWRNRSSKPATATVTVDVGAPAAAPAQSWAPRKGTLEVGQLLSAELGGEMPPAPAGAPAALNGGSVKRGKSGSKLIVGEA